MVFPETGEPVRTAVIGANGQDGSFLCENLLARGHAVLGLARQERPLHLDPATAGFTHARVDVRDTAALARTLAEFRPDAVFHVAALHGSNNPCYETLWQDMLAVNVGSVHVVAEYLRTVNPGGRLVYASSAKVFGTPLPPRVSERSPMRSSCLYTITKNTARELIEHYRRRHGLQASILYLFNHESERRPAGFFIPKVVAALARALSDPGHRETVATLDFSCDWGDAAEYMDIAADLAERAIGVDLILASGRTWHGRDFVEALFARHGLDYRRHLIAQNPPGPPAPPFHASIRRLRKVLGRGPRRDILEVCDRILMNTALKRG